MQCAEAFELLKVTGSSATEAVVVPDDHAGGTDAADEKLLDILFRFHSG